MKFESYARITHPLTNSWLSAKKSNNKVCMCFYSYYTLYNTATYARQQFDSSATGLNALKWDTAELKQIGVTNEMNYDDAFTIEEVTSHTNPCG